MTKLLVIGVEQLQSRLETQCSRHHPVEPARPAKTGEKWLAEAKRIRKGITLGGITIRELIEGGRKY